MTPEDFNISVTRQTQHCMDLLGMKGKEYAPGFDRLGAFKRAAAMQSCTQAQAALGMLAKHLVSVIDMINAESCTRYSSDKWDEKIGDSINYLLIIRAIVDEEKETLKCETSK